MQNKIEREGKSKGAWTVPLAAGQHQNQQEAKATAARTRPRIVATLTGSGKHICNDNVRFYF